jgi:5-methylcytosine-specific restriction endonuclease McrA
VVWTSPEQRRNFRKALRKKLIEERNSTCSKCGKVFRGASPNAHFHHIRETGVGGMGRGRERRLYDIKNNPERYVLLCRDCHTKIHKED